MNDSPSNALERADDLRALALAYEETIERDIVPWYEMQLVQDADAIEISEAQQRGEDPYRELNPDGSNNPKAFMRSLIKHGLIPALNEDLILLRVFMRAMNLLEPPGDLMKKPQVMQRLIASYAKRHERDPSKRVEGPGRDEMVALLNTGQ